MIDLHLLPQLSPDHRIDDTLDHIHQCRVIWSPFHLTELLGQWHQTPLGRSPDQEHMRLTLFSIPVFSVNR